MKKNITDRCKHLTICSQWRQGAKKLLSIAAGITFVWTAQIAIAQPIQVACYGGSTNGAPWHDETLETVFCSTNGDVLPGAVCYQLVVPYPPPIPAFCTISTTQTGWFCIQTNQGVTTSGKNGTPACILTNSQYNGMCINWIPFTNTNTPLPTVIMTQTPTTNTVCAPVPPPEG